MKTDTTTQLSIQDGWRCPRCNRVNAPWVRQCDCSLSTYGIAVNPWCDDWWKTQITCDIKIHPESTIYTTDVLGDNFLI